MRVRCLVTLAPLLALLLTACGQGHATVDPSVLSPLPSASAASIPGPGHVVLPADDAPHRDLTEWWYYTGHLDAGGGHTYGFELVIFQGLRSTDPPAYAAHFAITDNARGQFHYDQRTETGNQVHAGAGYDLNVNGWVMRGADGHDHLTANMPGYAIDLDLSSLKPAALHNGSGLISFGPAGASYYYSRTREAVTGTVLDHGESLPVSGLAWMDHQWGNFITGSGGWDWFSIQLANNTEYMLFFLRDASGQPVTPYGTYIDAAGHETTLPASAFHEQASSSWTSSATGITYPSGWTLTLPNTELTLTPTVKDQELDTTATTGQAYWEGDVSITGTASGQSIAGQGYVELVGYSR